ncbi:hypothetical protein ACFYYR_15845 [Streptomyces sp. NPDC001922]|uniref:hypothetical protein n=1 Tax=Streptomyces sp. NPDC001922 TaxID=3364624 RepID=UPI0036CD7B98
MTTSATGGSQDGRPQRGIPDGLLVGVLGFLLGLTLLVWTATGLAALFTHGAWPDGVAFTRTPLAMRHLVAEPHDLAAAWPGARPDRLSGYGLFWGILISELMVLFVLAVFVIGVLTRWKAVRTAARHDRDAAEATRGPGSPAPAPTTAPASTQGATGPYGPKAGGQGPTEHRPDGAPASWAPPVDPDPAAPYPGARPAAPGPAPTAPAGSTAPGTPAGRPGPALTTAPGHAFPPDTQHTFAPDTGTLGTGALGTGASGTPVPGTDDGPQRRPTVTTGTDGHHGTHRPTDGTAAADAVPGMPSADLPTPHREATPAPGTPAAGHPGAGAHGRSAAPGYATTAPPPQPATAPRSPAGLPDAATEAVATPQTAAAAASPARQQLTGVHFTGLRRGPDPAVQAVLDADGPVLVTTSDPAVWSRTKDTRAKLGPTHLYDPSHLLDTPSRLRWSPTAGCESRDVAAARATALLAPVRPPHALDSAMADAAATLLRCWLHAAAVDGKPFRQVHRWASGAAAHEPVRILRTNSRAASGSAGELEATLTGHPERRDIAQQLTARALSALSSIHIRDACNPKRADSLALESFVAEGGTLYVVGEAIEDPRTHPGAMPLLTALVSSVVEHGRRMAERSSAGRLDPPLTLVLDDVAAVAPLPQLPELLAEGPALGLRTLALLRSEEQARARWPHRSLAR